MHYSGEALNHYEPGSLHKRIAELKASLANAPVSTSAPLVLTEAEMRAEIASLNDKVVTLHAEDSVMKKRLADAVKVRTIPFSLSLFALN